MHHLYDHFAFSRIQVKDYFTRKNLSADSSFHSAYCFRIIIKFSCFLFSSNARALYFIYLFIRLSLLFLHATKTTFHYDSDLWSNNETFNVAGGVTGFDSQETKLPTYWKTRFSTICLGMKIGHQIRFIKINKTANSLMSLIADRQYRGTSLGRHTWKELIGSKASLQRHCNKEGFNVVGSSFQWSRARIGILANNENACSNCDSRIGFGTGGYHDNSSTCGNEASLGADRGDKHIKAMGFILVQ